MIGLPVDLPPCILQRPFFIAYPRQGFPVVLQCAPQRGCKASAARALRMDLSLFAMGPHPDDGLTVDLHMLHGHDLVTAVL